MIDQIPLTHKTNLPRGLRAKTLHFQWRTCHLQAGLEASGQFQEYKSGYKNPFLYIGKIIHLIWETLPDLIDTGIISSLYTRAQVMEALFDLFDWDKWANRQAFIPYIQMLVYYEADRWLECMQATQGNMVAVLADWKVRYSEVYYENHELQIAANVDRIEKIPGTENNYIMMEIKKKVRSNIRQELAWYWLAIQPWAERQHYCDEAEPMNFPNHKDVPATVNYICRDPECKKIGINITHWGAYDMEDPRKKFVSKVSKISLTTLRKHLAVFNEDMNELRDLRFSKLDPMKGKRFAILRWLDRYKSTRIMPNIMCAYCDFQSVCYSRVMFDLYGPEYGPLKDWEKERLTEQVRTDQITLAADNARSFTDVLEW